MDRRTALQNVGLLMGATLISADLFILGCKSDGSKSSDIKSLKEHESLIDSIANTILPKTEKHPGFVGIGGIVTLMTILTDCYTQKDKEVLIKGLEDLQSSSNTAFKKNFELLTPEEQNKMIAEIDTKLFAKETKEEDKPKYFAIIKESALLTYFTDKKVMTEVLKYVKVPGKYDGNFTIDPNQYDTIYGLGA